MDEETVNTIVAASLAIGFLLLFVMAGWWQRQRKRFARGADPVLICALRRPAPWGVGWRSGHLKLTADTMLWRSNWSFRATPQLVLPRHQLTLSSQTRATLQSSLAMTGGDVLHLHDSVGQLEVALFPDDAELFQEWLDGQAVPPPSRSAPSLSLILWLGWLAALAVYAVVRQERLFPLAVGLGVAVIIGLGVRATSWMRSRRARSQTLNDEFVRDALEEFSFLHDFGFGDVRVRSVPWSVVVVFDGSGRRVRVRLDRRRDRLDLVMERRGGRAQTLRDLLSDSGHPNPDRVTRYQGADGPMRAALAANAHALRLWGRPFLTDSGSGATEN